MTFTDIQNRVYFLTSTDSTSYSAANLTLAVGRALERVVSLINKNYSGWQWSDSNYGDLDMATLTVTSGQQQYTLATTHRAIDRIEVKDSNGNWKRLRQVDQSQFTRDKDQALALGEATPSTGRGGAYLATPGTPIEYDVTGIRLFLFPVPNYTLAAAMRIYFARAPLLFDYATGKFTDATGSTSSSPGFDSLFHDLIPLWASYDYGIAVGKQNAMQIFAEIQRKELELVDAYGRRNRDANRGFGISVDSNK